LRIITNSARKMTDGAMTQLSGMECYQTWINVGESVGMTIAKTIGPTVLEIVRHYYPTLDKRPAHHESDLTLLYNGVRFS
jgi:hypothetical protein